MMFEDGKAYAIAGKKATEDLAALGVVLAERLIALDDGRESTGGV